MKNNSLVIWKDIYMPVHLDFAHVHKIGGNLCHKACPDDFADLPVVVINDITKNAEAVVNNRGRAYAARVRLKYRRNKKKDIGRSGR